MHVDVDDTPKVLRVQGVCDEKDEDRDETHRVHHATAGCDRKDWRVESAGGGLAGSYRRRPLS